jgi:hypothetical protein
MIRPYNFARYRTLLVEKYEVSEEDFNQQHTAWIVKAGHSLESEKAFLWHFLEHWATVLAERHPDTIRRYQQLRAFYLVLWCFQIVEEKDGTTYMKLANYYELKAAELADYKTYVTVIGGNRCTAAEAFNGMATPLDEALVNQPIPYADCSRPHGCICCYGVHGVRDLNDKLVKK